MYRNIHFYCKSALELLIVIMRSLKDFDFCVTVCVHAFGKNILAFKNSIQQGNIRILRKKMDVFFIDCIFLRAVTVYCDYKMIYLIY